jgi:DNA repair exonuclease SbcCD ATPase subunit
MFALDQGLTLTGQAQRVVPVFRYEYLRDKAKEIISHIQDIESRMLPIQFKLDDFAEAVSTIRFHLDEQRAELEAANQKIKELTQTLTALVQAEREVESVVRGVVNAQGQCDCGFWCWVGGIVTGLFGIFLDIVGLAAILAGQAAGGALLALGIYVDLQAINTVTCDSIKSVSSALTNARDALRRAIQENEAELNHELAVRDILVANINAISHELSEVYASNAARGLSAGTLNVIQAQYDSIRQSLFTRAQAVAKLAEDAFNFERDSEVRLIKDTYADGLHQDKKGYTHAETLLRDLDGLDYIDVTGRTQKAMQLSHIVSLRKHYPISFPSIFTVGKPRLVTEMSDFDRWVPGTYMQRIKEVR